MTYQRLYNININMISTICCPQIKNLTEKTKIQHNVELKTGNKKTYNMTSHICGVVRKKYLTL